MISEKRMKFKILGKTGWKKRKIFELDREKKGRFVRIFWIFTNLEIKKEKLEKKYLQNFF